MAQVHEAITASRSCRCDICLQIPLGQGQIRGKMHEQPSPKSSNNRKTNPFLKSSTTIESNKGESSVTNGKWDVQSPHTNGKGKEFEPRTNSGEMIISSTEDDPNSSDDENATSDNSSSEEYLSDSFSPESPERNGSLSQVEKLKTEIAKQTRAKLDLEDKIKEKDQRIEELDKQIEELQERQVQSNSVSEITDFEGVREGLRRLCKELIRDKKELQKKLKEAYSKIKRLEAQLKELKRESDKHAEELQEQLDRTKRELTQLKAERDDYTKSADNSQVIVENGETIEQLETAASVATPQETVGQTHPRTSPSLASTTLQEGSQRAASHRRHSSGSKHSHSSKKEGKITGMYQDIFGRGTKKQIACPR